MFHCFVLKTKLLFVVFSQIVNHEIVIFSHVITRNVQEVICSMIYVYIMLSVTDSDLSLTQKFAYGEEPAGKYNIIYNKFPFSGHVNPFH